MRRPRRLRRAEPARSAARARICRAPTIRARRPRASHGDAHARGCPPARCQRREEARVPGAPAGSNQELATPSGSRRTGGWIAPRPPWPAPEPQAVWPDRRVSRRRAGAPASATRPSALQLRVAAAIVQQRSATSGARPVHFAHINRVVAGVVTLEQAALEVGDRVVDQKDAAFGAAEADSVEPTPRRQLGEAARNRFLLLRENADAEMLGL